MKYIITCLLVFLFFSNSINAKYVEFSVNMNNDSISGNGVHVTGDFQIAAGFAGGNWNPATIKINSNRNVWYLSCYPSTYRRKRSMNINNVNGDQFL